MEFLATLKPETRAQYIKNEEERHRKEQAAQQKLLIISENERVRKQHLDAIKRQEDERRTKDEARLTQLAHKEFIETLKQEGAEEIQRESALMLTRKKNMDIEIDAERRRISDQRNILMTKKTTMEDGRGLNRLQQEIDDLFGEELVLDQQEQDYV